MRRRRWRLPSGVARWPEVRLVSRAGAWPPRDPRTRSPDVSQDAPVGPGGRLRVEEDRQVEALGDGGREVAGALDACSIVVSPERHEGHDVHGTDARVLALLHAHVDALDGHLDRPLHGRHHPARVARHGVDAALVVCVRRLVQEPDAAVAADGVSDRVQRLGTGALAEVGDALDAGSPWPPMLAGRPWRRETSQARCASLG